MRRRGGGWLGGDTEWLPPQVSLTMRATDDDSMVDMSDDDTMSIKPKPKPSISPKKKRARKLEGRRSSMRGLVSKPDVKELEKAILKWRGMAREPSI